jgi:hypothetical protein
VAGAFDIADDGPARPELKLRREKPASTPIKLRPAAPDADAPTAPESRKPRKPGVDDTVSDSDDTGTRARGPKPGHTPARDADPEPQAAAKPEENAHKAHPGGAQPTPPDQPPGRKADRPYDHPPANPDPPGRRQP